MTKICFLLGGFQSNGGIGRVTSILANAMSDVDDFEIHTISYIEDDRPLLYDIKPTVHQHSIFNRPYSMTKAMLLQHVTKGVKKFIISEQIDCLIACGVLYYPLAILACKYTQTKCMCWEHINPATTCDYKFQGLCRKIGIKYADKLVVLTKAAQKFYLEKLHAKENKTYQIYNPIDGKGNKNYNIKSKKIISVGRLCYQKNFSILLDVANKVLKENPDWIWDIYGEGELYKELLQKVNYLNLSSQVHFKGQVDDLYNRYSQYSFMVMTSRYEGFPMSLLEGANNSLPLVCFDIPTGPNEIIDNGVNGFLIPPFETTEMISSIDLLIKNEELRMAYARKSKEICNQFMLERIIGQWTQIID